MYCVWKLLSELIDSPIDQQTYWDWKLLTEPIDSPTEQKNLLQLGALIRVHDSPIDKQIYSNWELLSEHIDSIYSLVSLATVAIVKFNQLMEIIPYY